MIFFNGPTLYLFAMLFICEAAFVFQHNYKSCVNVKSTQVQKKKHTVVEREDFQFPERVYNATLENQILYFKMCGHLDKGLCGEDSVACLLNNRTQKSINFGPKFQFDDIGLTVSGPECTPSKNYSLTVKLHCPRYLQIPPAVVRQTADCMYETVILDPNCDLPCSVNIGGRFIDLSPLNRSYCIESELNKMYCISLCGINQHCVQNNKNKRYDKNDLNACELTNGVSQDISLASTVKAVYNGDKNLISFHGSLHEIGKSKIINHLHVNLKCNWENTIANNKDLHHIKKMTQGKFYDFDLETIHGCIKKPISCLITEDVFLYDLSGLYSSHKEKWRVKNSSGELYLNICGPLELPADYGECLATYAQVCENIEGRKVNRGTILRNLELVYDVIYAKIENGSQCDENSQKENTQYTTFIEFHCDKSEHGPYLIRQENCSTYILWRTPYACPKFDVSRCSYGASTSHSCTFSRNDSYYYLNSIRQQKVVLNDTSEFYISICGSAIVDDAPCMKDASVVLVNTTEFNKKKRVFSLGKLSDVQTETGNLVLRYTAGQYCGEGRDYTSAIMFRCSEIDEGPFLVNETKCSFEFEWKTPHGCPINESLGESCTLYDSVNNRTYDFQGMQTQIHVKNVNTTYIFDFCRQNYTTCDTGNCVTKLLLDTPSLVANHNVISVQMFLATNCEHSADFKVIKFEFACDKIEHNEHIQSFQVDDCVLHVNYATSIVCIEQDVERAIDCQIESPYSGSKLNISQLQYYYGEIPLYERCPEAIFNDTLSFVKLLYPKNECFSDFKSTNSSYYEVFLKCSEDSVSRIFKRDQCQLHISGIEFCNYFAPHSSTALKIILGSCGGIVILGVLLVLWYLFLRKRESYISISSFNYVRDTEL